MMKLMTLNCHSLEEPDYENKLLAFVAAMGREMPDILALQEVNQLSGEAGKISGTPIPFAPVASSHSLAACGFVPCPEGGGQIVRPAFTTGGSTSSLPAPTDSPTATLRTDNHAYRAAKLLSQGGLTYHWTWVPSKIGYDKYDEGLALFSRRPILAAHQFYITDSRDYANWKTRKILGITVDTDQGVQHFFTVHMGWWEDVQEPFAGQWQRIEDELADFPGGQIWLMGDFNSPAHISGQGHDLIRSRGWLDTYELASRHDPGITVDRAIDGWKQYPSPSGMRIDYIWTNREIPVKSSRVLFNNQNYPVVSDHFGVMVEI